MGYNSVPNTTPLTNPSRYPLEEFMDLFAKILGSVSSEVLIFKGMILLTGNTVIREGRNICDIQTIH